MRPVVAALALAFLAVACDTGPDGSPPLAVDDRPACVALDWKCTVLWTYEPTGFRKWECFACIDGWRERRIAVTFDVGSSVYADGYCGKAVDTNFVPEPCQ